MISRVAVKLGNRKGILGGEGPAGRAIALARRPLGRLELRRGGRLTDLERLGEGTAEGESTGEGKRVLVASLRAWTPHNAYESVFAQALKLRGAEVALLTCGGGQPLCEQGWARHAWPRPCDRCGWYTDRVAEASGLHKYRLADTLPWGGDSRDAPASAPAGDGTGGSDPHEAAQISLPWMLKSTDVEGSPNGAAMSEEFAVAAAGDRAAAEAVLDDFRPDVVVLLNGLFAAERVIRDAALARGIETVTYEMAPRRDSLVFSAGTPAPLYDTDAAWAESRDRPLTPPQRGAIESMLKARVEGTASHESYFAAQVDDASRLRGELGIPAGSRVVSLFTNLAWDSAVIGRDIAYPSMHDWIADTMAAMAGIPDATLVIRVHPAEVHWGTKQPIAESLGDLPANVRVIGPEQPLSSYALLELSDLVLAYTTTVGLEAAVRGIPVSVAAMTHYRGRGFTFDHETPEDLRGLLASGTWKMPERGAELALRYAFAFFFRCMIPFPAISIEGGHPSAIPEAADLAPGADPFLDFICGRILDGGEFILPDELALLGTEAAVPV